MTNLFLTLFVALASLFIIPSAAFSQSSLPYETETSSSGFFIKNPELKKDISTNLFFLNSINLNESSVSGHIRTNIKKENPLSTTLELFSKNFSKRNTGIKILPDGSVVMGGVSNNFTNPGLSTNEIPQELPTGFEDLDQKRRQEGIYDLFLSMPVVGDDKSRSALFVRNLAVQDIGDPVDIVIRRAQGPQAEQQIRYGQMYPVPPNFSLGVIKWQAYGLDGLWGISAAIAAKNDDWVRSGYNPGSLYFATADGSGADELKNRMVIRHNGNIGVNTDEPKEKLHVNGNLRVANNLIVEGYLNPEKATKMGEAHIASDALVGRSLRVESVSQLVGGIETSSCSGCSNTSSDQRLKKNITPISDALNKLLKVRGVTYEWKQDIKGYNFSKEKQLGLIAQEVETVFPEAVGEDNNGFKTVDYTKLVPVLIEALKEHEDEINNLKQELRQLKNTGT